MGKVNMIDLGACFVDDFTLRQRTRGQMRSKHIEIPARQRGEQFVVQRAG